MSQCDRSLAIEISAVIEQSIEIYLISKTDIFTNCFYFVYFLHFPYIKTASMIN